MYSHHSDFPFASKSSHLGEIIDLSVLGDNIITASSEGIVILKNGEKECHWDEKGTISVAWCPDGSKFAFCDLHSVRIRERQSGLDVASFDFPYHQSDNEYSFGNKICFSQAGTLICVRSLSNHERSENSGQWFEIDAKTGTLYGQGNLKGMPRVLGRVAEQVVVVTENGTEFFENDHFFPFERHLISALLNESSGLIVLEFLSLKKGGKRYRTNLVEQECRHVLTNEVIWKQNISVGHDFTRRIMVPMDNSHLICFEKQTGQIGAVNSKKTKLFKLYTCRVPQRTP
jgi:hypothetical protein